MHTNKHTHTKPSMSSGISVLYPTKNRRRSLSFSIIHSPFARWFGVSRALFITFYHLSFTLLCRLYCCCWWFFLLLPFVRVLFVIVRKSCAKSHQSLVNGGVVFVSLCSVLSTARRSRVFAVLYDNV